MIAEFLFEPPPSEHNFTPEEHAKIRDFLAYDQKHGPEVLQVFYSLASLANQRKWPLKLGADTLRGWARGTVKNFTLHNDFAPFYAAALLWLYPKAFANCIECEAELPKQLLASGEWKPSLEGGPRHD